ncbi:MAG: FHA domain-containing protein [Lachnospiraceae bacterium]|nr:FHA domain-containing protein [Lachnospiraceae bacterium]
MRKFTYENQGSNTYLVYPITDEEIDEMSLGMLTNNKISGFASTLFTQMDTDKYMKYNVSSKISAKQLFEGRVKKKQLISVFKGIVNAFMSAEDYMIAPGAIVCDLDYIFVDITSYETVVICLPVISDQQAVDLASFFKTILFSVQFDSDENTDYVAKIISLLNAKSGLVLGEFKKCLEDIESEGAGKNVREQNRPAAAYVAPPVINPVRSQQVQQPVNVSGNNENPANAQMKAMQSNAKPPVQSQVPVQPVQPQGPVQPMQPQAPRMPGGNVAMPGARVPNASAPQPAPVIPTIDKKDEISMFYLLQHYNKENAAKYKAQQEIKKMQKAAKTGGSAAKPAKNAKQAASKKGAPMPAGVAIPGQPQPIAPVGGAKPVGVAIPGMAAPVTPMGGAPQQAAPAMAQPQVRPVQPQAVTPQPVQPAMTPMPQAMPQGVPVNFGETTVLGGGSIGETTVLDMTPPAKIDKPYLLRIKNGEKIYVDKSIFRIGKEKSNVDYFIGDNPAISRNHASIICRAGVYYITDLNSTNHTFVNGEKLAGNVETKLDQGAKIRLANEEYEFKLV